jgi:hypothetical protein
MNERRGKQASGRRFRVYHGETAEDEDDDEDDVDSDPTGRYCVDPRERIVVKNGG